MTGNQRIISPGSQSTVSTDTGLPTHNLCLLQQSVPNWNSKGSKSPWTFKSSDKSKRLRVIQRKPYPKSATFEDCLSCIQKDLIWNRSFVFFFFFFPESFIKVQILWSVCNFAFVSFMLNLFFFFFYHNFICMSGKARRKKKNLSRIEAFIWCEPFPPVKTWIGEN